MSRVAPVVGLVDYQAGNVHSIDNAFVTLSARTRRVRVVGDIEGCSHLVLPGVGAFGFCAERLRQSGFTPRLYRWVFEEHRPLLGICVGMQLLADRSDESPGAQGLGWVGGTVRRIAAGPAVRVPHVGWNTVRFDHACGEFEAGAGADFYFDHSFAYNDPRDGQTVGQCTHGTRFSAVLRRGNLMAAQFHPEKSQTAGMRFLRGFLSQ